MLWRHCSEGPLGPNQFISIFILQNAPLASALQKMIYCVSVVFSIFTALRHYFMLGNHFHGNWNTRLVKTFPCVAAYMSSLAIIAIAIDRFMCYSNFPHFALLFIHSTCKECLFFISPLVKHWLSKLAIFASLLYLWHIPSFLLFLINLSIISKIVFPLFLFCKKKNTLSHQILWTSKYYKLTKADWPLKHYQHQWKLQKHNQT